MKDQRCGNMKYLFFLILVKSAWGFTSRNPMENPNLFQGDVIGKDRGYTGRNPMENPNLFQGDIIGRNRRYTSRNPMENPNIFQGDIMRKNRRYTSRNPMENPNLFQGDVIGKDRSYTGRNPMENPNLFQGDIIGRNRRYTSRNPMENTNLFQGDIMRKNRRYTSRNPMENPSLFQGDIIDMNESERNAKQNNTYLWPGGIIPYKMEGVDDLKNEIEIAMKHIMDRTCIKFVPWDGLESGYLKIISGDGCYSYWGRTGKVQPLSLGDGCGIIGTILHELMHAMGFEHEQNRSDRDDYLVVFWQNILPEALGQFDKLKPSENRLINEFDYDSIMLYGEKTFSKDGWSKTIKARKKGIKLRGVITKNKLSVSDVYRINTLYKCGKNSVR